MAMQSWWSQCTERHKNIHCHIVRCRIAWSIFRGGVFKRSRHNICSLENLTHFVFFTKEYNTNIFSVSKPKTHGHVCNIFAMFAQDRVELAVTYAKKHHNSFEPAKTLERCNLHSEYWVAFGYFFSISFLKGKNWFSGWMWFSPGAVWAFRVVRKCTWSITSFFCFHRLRGRSKWHQFPAAQTVFKQRNPQIS